MMTNPYCGCPDRARRSAHCLHLRCGRSPLVSGIVVAFLIAVTSPVASSATNTYWIGGGDYMWDNPVNWDLGHVPLAGENVYLLNSGASHLVVAYRNLVNPSDRLGR